MVALAVPVFCAVKDGWCGLADQQGERAARQGDGQGPVRCCREALGGKSRIGGERGAAGVCGQQRLGEIAPEEGGEILKVRLINREAGQDGEAALARKVAKAL